MSLNTNKKMEGVVLYIKKDYMQNHQTQSYFLNSEKNKRSMGQQRNHVSIRNCGMEIEQLH